MGNQQSNENVRTRKRAIHVEPKSKESADLSHYEVVKKEEHSSFARFYLSGYVTYKDGSYKYIDFDKEAMKLTLRELDLNYIQNYNHTKTFGIKEIWGVIGMTEPRIGWEDSEGNFRDSKGNIITDTLGVIESVGEIIGERQKFVASIEQSRHATNHAWTKQTSWDVPPGWK